MTPIEAACAVRSRADSYPRNTYDAVDMTDTVVLDDLHMLIDFEVFSMSNISDIMGIPRERLRLVARRPNSRVGGRLNVEDLWAILDLWAGHYGSGLLLDRDVQRVVGNGTSGRMLSKITEIPNTTLRRRINGRA